MTREQYARQCADWRRLTEERLTVLCDEAFVPGARIGQAARYSLLGGGKRIRALLTLAACRLAGGDETAALDYACALEMLHCYSLIHDDLPCMDDDDTRRGQPSCHKKFDEATALLAADALVTAAFAVVAGAPANAESRVQAAAVLAGGGGGRGMLYGQELDKRFETEPAEAEQLLSLHRHKTGALILAAVRLGLAGGTAADETTRQALEDYARHLGLGFQIVDDILDVTASSEALGKPAGSDAANGKTTFVTLYGLAGARARAAEETEAALRALDGFGPNGDFLRRLAEELLRRER